MTRVETDTGPVRKPRLIYGVAINDASYKVRPEIGGESKTCPFYRVWHSMLTRVYGPSALARRSSYREASICKEWLAFTVFRDWMVAQDWKGKQLDKDILSPEEKHYSPSTCLFVDSEINMLFTNHKSSIGRYPVGVNKYRRRYRSQIVIHGEKIYLGMFDTPDLANLAYREAKYKHVMELAQLQKDGRISDGLIKRAESLIAGERPW